MSLGKVIKLDFLPDKDLSGNGVQMFGQGFEIAREMRRLFGFVPSLFLSVPRVEEFPLGQAWVIGMAPIVDMNARDGSGFIVFDGCLMEEMVDFVGVELSIVIGILFVEMGLDNLLEGFGRLILRASHHGHNRQKKQPTKVESDHFAFLFAGVT